MSAVIGGLTREIVSAAAESLKSASMGRCARSLKEIEAIANLLVERLDTLTERFEGRCSCKTCQFDRRPPSDILLWGRGERLEISKDLSGAKWALGQMLTVLRSEWLPPFEGEFEVLVRPLD
jgi:hypothetical protein